MSYLHTGLAINIVDIAHQSRYEVFLKRGKIRVDAKSILGVLSLVFLEGVSVESEDQEIAKAIRDTINDQIRGD